MAAGLPGTRIYMHNEYSCLQHSDTYMLLTRYIHRLFQMHKQDCHNILLEVYVGE